MYNEAFKVFGDFKTPAFDFNSLFEVHRRNFEALTAANQVVSEGVQAIARRQAEAFRTNVDSALSASKEFTASGTPEVNVEKQAALTSSLSQSRGESRTKTNKTGAVGARPAA